MDQDDTNVTIDTIAAADMILFATPVYWWGMSAQLKLIIDKCYCRVQYQLIQSQFECRAQYLFWDMLFHKSYYATAKDELARNAEAMQELERLGQNIR